MVIALDAAREISHDVELVGKFSIRPIAIPIFSTTLGDIITSPSPVLNASTLLRSSPY